MRIVRYAVIYSTEAKIGITPYLKIISGNHNTNCVGHFMFDSNYAKDAADDKDVVLECDHWIGINVTILSGVTVGRGSVIAAGAVLNKSVPPYSIVGGIPAKVLKYRFTIEEILEHEQVLYPPEKRYSKEQFEDARKKYELKMEQKRTNGNAIAYGDAVARKQLIIKCLYNTRYIA